MISGGAPRGPRLAAVRRVRWAAGVAVLCAVGVAVATSFWDGRQQTVYVSVPGAVAGANPALTPDARAGDGSTQGAQGLPGAQGAEGARPPGLPAADPVNPILNGAVLGAVRPVWIEARGQPSQGVFGELFAATSAVRWRDDYAGRARAAQVEVLTGARPVPVSRARGMAARFHPRDAERVGVYVDSQGQTVEVFRSQALAEAFAGADGAGARATFGAEPPGTYIQIAERRSATTMRVILALGNNPLALNLQ
jgi:hypothetical protein